MGQALFEPKAWALVILVHVVVTGIAAQRWELLLNGVKSSGPRKLSVKKMFWSSWASQFVGLFSFGMLGSDLYRGAKMHEYRVSSADSLKVLVQDRIVSLLGLALLVASSLAFSNLPTPFAIGISLTILGLGLRHRQIGQSLLMHALKITLVLTLAKLFFPYSFVDSKTVTGVGFGFLAEVLPVSWEGCGVGHLAFAKLVSQPSGGQLFSLYLGGKIAFKLLGVFPFLWQLAELRKDRYKSQLANTHALSFSVRTQIKKDHTEERARHFSVYLSQKPEIERLYRIFEKHAPTSLKALVAVLYGAWVMPFECENLNGHPLCVYKYKNEEKSIRALGETLSIRRFKEMNLNDRSRVATFAEKIFRGLVALPTLWQVYRLSLKICGKYPLYVSLRAQETIFSFIYFSELFREERPSVVLISSEGNPHGRAILGAGLKCKVPVVFVSHGAVAAEPVAIHCQMAVFYGSKAYEDFKQANSRIKHVLFYGFSAPVWKNTFDKKVCICLSQDPNIESLKTLVAKLSDQGYKILLRPHPHSLVKFNNFLDFQNIRLCVDESLAESIEACEYVVAGNSTVHLEILLCGVPSVYWSELDSGLAKKLNFLSEDLIADWSSGLTSSEIQKLYRSELWQHRFAKYMNTSYDQKSFLLRFENGIDDLIENRETARYGT